MGQESTGSVVDIMWSLILDTALTITMLGLLALIESLAAAIVLDWSIRIVIQASQFFTIISFLVTEFKRTTCLIRK